ncbi:MAG: hypothetical protein KGI64_05230 [Xanthomonadaceae bacterium]|nr:hypothetical protein [Xanthomonadaceae bacterium]MDE1885169.1 hypothetical protein [Xanthomonadaceae bacterium]MDE1960599.1 hypothetical protein [Xanthomonadaceae bacterium]MDE2084244.1 hypothetical protein [Xanthomonadaceae bacterium]MDE2256871.1 hypothetical protein [Xanthomonadaceae bacterium]
MRNIITFAIVALCAAIPARADTAVYMAQQLAHYQKYAQAPVERFPMVSLWQWQVVGKDKVVVWPTINTAYLITVYKPCINLDWARGIGITQNTSMHVDAKFDSIVFDHQNCRIQEIRPIDYKALRADENSAKAAKADAK